MAFEPIQITEAVVSDGRQGSVLVEPGPYLLQIASLKPSPEDHDGTPYILAALKIKKGRDGVGRSILEYFNLGENSQWRLGNMLYYADLEAVANAIAGKALNTYEEFERLVAAVAKKAVGKELGAEVTTDNYNAQNPKSKCAEFFFPADFSERYMGGDNDEDMDASPAPAKPKANSKKASVADELDDLEAMTAEVEEEEEIAVLPARAAKPAAKPAANKALAPNAKAQPSSKKPRSIEDEFADLGI